MYRTRERPAPQAHRWPDIGRPLRPGRKPVLARGWVTRREVNRSLVRKGGMGRSEKTVGMTGNGGTRCPQGYRTRFASLALPGASTGHTPFKECHGFLGRLARVCRDSLGIAQSPERRLKYLRRKPRMWRHPLPKGTTVELTACPFPSSNPRKASCFAGDWCF